MTMVNHTGFWKIFNAQVCPLTILVTFKYTKANKLGERYSQTKQTSWIPIKETNKHPQEIELRR